jgi:hypothetical protein
VFNTAMRNCAEQVAAQPGELHGVFMRVAQLMESLLGYSLSCRAYLARTAEYGVADSGSELYMWGSSWSDRIPYERTRVGRSCSSAPEDDFRSGTRARAMDEISEVDELSVRPSLPGAMGCSRQESVSDHALVSP